MFLTVEKLSANYRLKRVLFDISMSIEKEEIVLVIGPNGAGKSTLLRAIFGIHQQRDGKIIFNGQNISKNLCIKNLILGISYIPQGARVFGDLSVDENLIMGGYLLKDKDKKNEKIEEVQKIFPVLRGRGKQLAKTLSGGERQMLAIGMALLLTPKLMLLDEPSVGLAPFLVPKLMENIKGISQRFGTSILIVEQNARQALKIGNRVYVMRVGKITDMDKVEKFFSKEELRKVYLFKKEGNGGEENERKT